MTQQPHQIEIRNLHATVGDKEILKGINLVVPRGELHAIMGPNGNGKSTLAKVIVGDPEYTVTEGEVLVDGQNILDMEPDERARLGVFLAFQYPVEIPGVTIANFLRLAMQARKGEGEEVSFTEFYGKLQNALKLLEWDESIVERYLNEGMSGGEKKRNEILQMLMLEPNYIIGRDRLGPGRGRAQDCRQGRELHARRESGRPHHHPLPAPAGLHRSRQGSHHRERSRRRVGRP